MAPAPFPLMHPTLVARPFHRAGWVYEEKVDGWRMVAHKDGAAVRLISRQGKEFTQRFPELAKAVAAIGAASVILDAELSVFDQQFVPLIAAWGAIPCSTAAPSGVASVPIQTINRKFLVPVVLNEGQTATFLLDTGASTSVITPDLARRLGLDTSSRSTLGRARIASGQEVEVSMVRMTSIRVGSARIDNLNVAVYELPVIVNTNPPITVDGFLGVDFIGRFTMTVDPGAGTLTLQRHDPPTR